MHSTHAAFAAIVLDKTVAHWWQSQVINIGVAKFA